MEVVRRKSKAGSPKIIMPKGEDKRKMKTMDELMEKVAQTLGAELTIRVPLLAYWLKHEFYRCSLRFKEGIYGGALTVWHENGVQQTQVRLRNWGGSFDCIFLDPDGVRFGMRRKIGTMESQTYVHLHRNGMVSISLDNKYCEALVRWARQEKDFWTMG